MWQIVLVGTNHKTAPIELRERLAFTKSDLEKALTLLMSKENVQECVILSTCNRVEIYAVSNNTQKCIDDIKDFLHEYHRVEKIDVEEGFYVLIGSDAIKHIYRVASGMDSMIIGEPQILGQVKQAYFIAFDLGTTGIVLNRLFQSSFFVAKKIRSNTEIGSNAVSVSYLTVELAKRIFDDLPRRVVMLIGTGEMGELAAGYFLRERVKKLLISSRTYDSAISLSEKLGGEPVEMGKLYYLLKDVDIVITATGSSDFIIKQEHILQALKLRKNEPIFLIDIAVPRDIDPRVGDISGAYLYDIDDLQSIIEENTESRKESAKEAELIINDVEKNFSFWLESLKVFPTIVDLRRHFEQIKDEELKKALRKLERVDPKNVRVIERMAQAIIEKILYNPVTRLKQESSTSLGALYINALRELFDLSQKNILTKDPYENTEDRY